MGRKYQKTENRCGLTIIYNFTVVDVRAKQVRQSTHLIGRLYSRVAQYEYTILYLFLATLIRGNLDTRIKPCEDFYQFACGRFKPPKTNEGKTWKNVDIFIIVEDEVMKQLYKILTHTPQENKPLQLAAQYFDTCNQDGLYLCV